MRGQHIVGMIAVTAVAAVVGLAGCVLFQDEHVKKGADLYAYYCSHCHGEKGKPGQGYNWKFMPDPKPKDLSNKDEDRKSTRLNSSHSRASRMPSSA